ncbi:MAG: hypothetical protein IJY29_02355 [Ruminococcus sp.]|nr:hypothetical protein [Ruminococcus sp.]
MSRSYSRALPLRNGVYLFAAYNILCRNHGNATKKFLTIAKKSGSDLIQPFPD